MANTVVVADALIVVPELDDLVVAARDEVLALSVDGKGVELASVAAVEHADGLAVIAVPVGDLAVRASCQKL